MELCVCFATLIVVVVVLQPTYGFFHTNNLQCSTMRISNGSDPDPFWNQHKSHQSVQITATFLQENFASFSLFLENHVTCLFVFVTNQEILLPLINLLKSVEYHLIVYSGSKRPVDAILTKEDKPVIILKEESNHKRNISVFAEIYCPRETKSTTAYTKQDILTNPFNPEWIYDISANVSTICPNSLFNQTLYGSASAGIIRRNGKVVGGYYVSLFWYLGEKFHFNTIFEAGQSKYNPKTKSFTGRTKKVLDREHLITSGALTNIYFSKFDFMPSHVSYRVTFASRIARPTESYANMLLPFSHELWLLILFVGLVFSVLFYITNSAYEKLSFLTAQKFHKEEKFKVNFLLYTTAKITEPDPLPWFSEKWSAGKLLTFLWAVWGLFIVMCYNSNLRAYLTSPKYEKNLDTIQDVADNDKINWLPITFVNLQPWYLEATGQANGPLYEISTKVATVKSYYDTTKHGGVSGQAVKDALDKRGTFLGVRDNFPQVQYRLKDTLKGEKLYLAKEDVLILTSCFLMRKHHYMRQEIHDAIQTVIEFGLIKKWSNEFLPAEFVLPQSLIKKEKQAEENKTLRKLKLLHLMILLIFYPVAMCIAFVFFILENRKK